MTRALETPVSGIPCHDTAHVGASGRHQMQLSALIHVRSKGLAVSFDHAPLPRLELGLELSDRPAEEEVGACLLENGPRHRVAQEHPDSRHSLIADNDQIRVGFLGGLKNLFGRVALEHP